ncbi:MAG: SOS response-associated peptidase [Candidatus Lambdaproteobacteria bacterium]|nr:SOS response-associated peptidase [Candidatus Lambdaproteobacteria bacterium]
MCGRFSLRASAGAVQEAFALAEPPPLAPRYNIAPAQPVLTVRQGRMGAREAVLLLWGLVPSSAKHPALGARLINARAETCAVKPSFRAAFRHRRCLVPADGYYEWQRAAAGGGKPLRQPYHLRLTEGGPFGIGALWEHWQDPAGNELETVVLLTTAPNAVSAAIHDWMPLIVLPQHYERWLDPRIGKVEALADIMAPYPAEPMTAVAVGAYVNSARNEGPLCLEPPASPASSAPPRGVPASSPQQARLFDDTET